MTAIADVIATAAGRIPPRGDLAAEPVRRLVVLTCMDARLDPLRDLGLGAGDAHVLRNAGGRATPDAMRSLLLSWHTLGTREVLVLHHTTCGARVGDEAALRADLERRAGADLADMPLHTFDNDEAAVRADVQHIRSAPFAPVGLVVAGALHEVETGRLLVIDAGTPQTGEQS